MSAIENIKNGIIQDDMDLVARGYKDLTGEVVVPLNKSDGPIFIKLLDDITKILEHHFNMPQTIEKNENTKVLIDKEISQPSTNPIIQPIGNSPSDSKIGIFGNKTRLITSEDLGEKIDPKEIEENKIRAQKTIKKTRHSSIFEIPCTKCGKKISTPIKSSELGQTCTSCIINMHGKDPDE